MLRAPSALIPIIAACILLPSTAGATITIQPFNVSQVQIGNDISSLGSYLAYYGVKLGSTIGTATADIFDSDYKLMDVSQTQDSDSGRTDIFYFDVSSTASAVAGKQLLLTVSVSGVQVPIAYVAGTICGSSGAVDTGLCQDTRSVSVYANPPATSPFTSRSFSYAAKFTAGSTLRIGIYPADICNVYGQSANPNGSGCASGTVSIQSGTPAVLPLLLEIKPGGTSGPPDTGAVAVDSTTLKLNMQMDAPGLGCPAMPATDADRQSIYFPGDGEIILNTTLFSNSEAALIPNLAPNNALYVVASDGGTPNTTVSNLAFKSGNSLVQLIPWGDSNQMVGGFTNTTDGSDHKYNTSFILKDMAGMLSASAGACTISAIQTSKIQGFLASSKCFIATAAFRSGEAAPVMLLRAFRDHVLLHTEAGKAFVSWYYSWSPESAEWLLENAWFRVPVLVLLIPLEVMAWFLVHGIGVLLLMGCLALIPSVLILKSRKAGFFLTCAILAALQSTSVRAEDESVQPYIDRLKQGMKQTSEPTESYTESIRKKLPPANTSTAEEPEKYINELKKSMPAVPKNETEGTESYIEKEKARLQAQEKPGQEESAIAKVKEGRSELHARREGPIHHAFGLKMATSSTRNITAKAGAGLRDFNDVYGIDWAPDATLFYEYQPFHSEWFGNVGILLSAGTSYYHGLGSFQVALPGFPSTSKTKLGFFEIPVTAALNYRFNLFRVVRPYVAAGPNVIGYMETRSDDQSGNRGYSTGLWMSGGVAFLLDWISAGSAWDLYAQYDIKHYYLTVEYNRQATFSGDVDFSTSGVFAGLMFEY